MSAVDEVRALHVPDEYYQIDCAECGEGYIEWPCPTATIVYSPDEIKATLDAVAVSRKAQAEARVAQLIAHMGWAP